METSVEAIWQCQVFETRGTRHFVALHHSLPPTPIEALVVLAKPRIKLSKMSGNLTSYALKKVDILNDLELHASSSMHSRDRKN